MGSSDLILHYIRAWAPIIKNWSEGTELNCQTSKEPINMKCRLGKDILKVTGGPR
jgi:hypothetical protein